MATIVVAKNVTLRDLVIHILMWTGRVVIHNALKFLLKRPKKILPTKRVYSQK